MASSFLFPRPLRRWRLRGRTLELGERTLIMGILNCTPDSFSDGGRHRSVADAVRHGLALLDDGADLLDLGAESTRPGATPVEAALEQQRLLPVLQRLRQLRPDALLSVDTYHAATAAASLACGADSINDVSGLQWDPHMTDELASHSPTPGLVLMHARGTPQTWRNLPGLQAGTAAAVVEQELADRLALAERHGIPSDHIALDPGFGFGKRGDENLDLLAHLPVLHRLGRPLLIGLSRKGFLASGSDAAPLSSAGALSPDRQYATAAAHTASVLAGAHLLRVHDVVAARAAASIGDRLQRAASL